MAKVFTLTQNAGRDLLPTAKPFHIQTLIAFVSVRAQVYPGLKRPSEVTPGSLVVG
jgi:hypothetical protein